MAVLMLVWFFLIVLTNGELEMGVNWGNIAAHPLPPKIVVQLLKDNGYKKVKLFDCDPKTLLALEGSNMDVMVAIPNLQLAQMADSVANAEGWVEENLMDFVDKVKIKYVAVGNEPFLKSYNGSFMKTTFPALKNVQKALDKADLGKRIKATVPLNADVYESPTSKPSDGRFRTDVKNLMEDIVKFLKQNNAPFVVNIYPFLSLYENDNFPIEFAFFGNGRTVDDKGNQYNNVLDANYDTLLWALKKINMADIKIIIGEIGWPTDGNKHATVQNAQKFYNGLFKRLNDNKGTPLQSSAKFDVYLFGLLDEDMKSIAPGYFERHWGIFQYDGKPKFPMDITGRGNDKWPIAAKNVEYLDSKWCVLDTELVPDPSKSWLVQKQIDMACQYGDCTSLAEGSSCNFMDKKGHASYAFNMFYQIKGQEDSACDFEGMAKITEKNASQGSCLFPIMIDSGGVGGRGSVGRMFLGVLMMLFLLI